MEGLANRQLSAQVSLDFSASAAPHAVSLMAMMTLPVPVMFGRPADDLSPYEREKAAFLRKRPYLRLYSGKFVAIHGGEVAVADKSRNETIRQFFAKYPAGTSVYIGFVGSKPVAHVSPQFSVRRPS